MTIVCRRISCQFRAFDEGERDYTITFRIYLGFVWVLDWHIIDRIVSTMPIEESSMAIVCRRVTLKFRAFNKFERYDTVTVRIYLGFVWVLDWHIRNFVVCTMPIEESSMTIVCRRISCQFGAFDEGERYDTITVRIYLGFVWVLDWHI